MYRGALVWLISAAIIIPFWIIFAFLLLKILGGIHFLSTSVSSMFRVDRKIADVVLKYLWTKVIRLMTFLGHNTLIKAASKLFSATRDRLSTSRMGVLVNGYLLPKIHSSWSWISAYIIYGPFTPWVWIPKRYSQWRQTINFQKVIEE